MFHQRTSWIYIMGAMVLVALGLAGGCSKSGPPRLLEAKFCQGLDEHKAAISPTTDFQAGEKVCLSLKFEDRPSKGLVKAVFFLKDDPIAEAQVDFSEVNKGMLFAYGEHTFAGFTLTSGKPFPLSDKYRAEVSLNGQPLGAYTFRIVAPAGAIASKVAQAVLAREADDNYNPVDPATIFRFDQAAYLVGRGDFGIGTWIQVDWYENDRLLEKGTRSLTLQENKSGCGFSFYFLPDGGWKSGPHKVILTMNDHEVGQYAFTIE